MNIIRRMFGARRPAPVAAPSLPTGPLCAVLGCDRPPTVAYGHHRDTVTVCGSHAPGVV